MLTGPVYKSGQLFESIGLADLLLVSANSQMKANGDLVMGAGIAKQAALRYPLLPRLAGELLSQTFHGAQGQHYGVLLTPVEEDGTRIGLFQSKQWWASKSTPGIIHASAQSLNLISSGFKNIVMNMPGVGLGGLPVDVVKKELCILSDVVTVFTLE